MWIKIKLKSEPQQEYKYHEIDKDDFEDHVEELGLNLENLSDTDINDVLEEIIYEFSIIEDDYDSYDDFDYDDFDYSIAETIPTKLINEKLEMLGKRMDEIKAELMKYHTMLEMKNFITNDEMMIE